MIPFYFHKAILLLTHSLKQTNLANYLSEQFNSSFLLNIYFLFRLYTYEYYTLKYIVYHDCEFFYIYCHQTLIKKKHSRSTILPTIEQYIIL